MNESTKTKKALRGSLFALFLCIVLLIGTTFAWFTDTASTGVNKITAGNLKQLDFSTRLLMEAGRMRQQQHWIFRKQKVLKMKQSSGSLDVSINFQKSV